MYTVKAIDASVNQVEAAKNFVIEITKREIGDQKDFFSLFYSDDLSEIEDGIKSLNVFSKKAWLLSAMLLYTKVFDINLYTQSGKTWSEYVSDSTNKLGLDKRDLSEQISAARFLISHYPRLKRAGWEPTGSNRKLARAELAYELSGDLNATIKHLKTDTWEEFNKWYSSFKAQKALPTPTENIRDDISVSRKGVQIGGEELFTVNDKIPTEEKNRFYEIAAKVYTLIKNGYKPLIIDVYDDKEAKSLVRMRDEARKNR